jgi:hypothetical protein
MVSTPKMEFELDNHASNDTSDSSGRACVFGYTSAVRDIENGRDARRSDVETVAAALGLELTLVEPVRQGR